MKLQVLTLPSEEKAKILDLFIEQIQEINKSCGTTFGTYQILDTLESIGVKQGFIECPCCHQKIKKGGSK